MATSLFTFSAVTSAADLSAVFNARSLYAVLEEKSSGSGRGRVDARVATP